MGTVYEAEDESSGAVVAVKTMAAHLDDDAGSRRRFLAEIEALKTLRHPGIVQLLAFGEENGRPYFAMELVRGRSLEDLLRSGRRFSWRETLDTAIEVARALKAAHDHGVVHRDLKPANLLFVDQPAPGPGVKLADFGIARLFGDAGQTQPGFIVGTAEYMAPEQAAGAAVDPRTDFYALGMVMFAMLTGGPAFQGGTALGIIDRQQREPPPRVAQLVPEVPAELDALVDRLLAKNPADRPASALALGRLLAAIATLRPPGEAPGAPPPAANVDLLAETLGMPTPADRTAGAAVIAADITAPAANAASPTKAAPAGPPGTEPRRSPVPTARTRFTTVEELHRAARELEARDRRRDAVARAAAAVGGGLLLAVAGFALLRPPTADELYERIMTIAADDEADLRDARPAIDRFLARHPDDPRAGAVGDLDRTLDLDALERRMRKRVRNGRVPPPLERDYRAAMAREPESPAACLAALEALLTVHAADEGTADADRELWLALVRRQRARLGPLADREREQDVERAAAALAEAADLAISAEDAADAAGRNELVRRRRTLLESLVEIYASRPHVAAAVAEARRLLAADPAP